MSVRINRKAANNRQRQRRECDGRFMRWGVVVEQMIESGRMAPDKWAEECRRYLSRDKDLQRALSGPLAGHGGRRQEEQKPEGDQSRRESNSNRDFVE